MESRKKTSVFVLKFLLFVVLFVIVFILLARVGYVVVGTRMFPNFNVVFKENFVPSEKQIIVLDAGHGGIDNGAVSINGVNEKNLNLEVAKRVGEILSIYDFDVKYTRTDDSLLSTDNKKVKRSDLTNRVKFTNELEDPLFVSIHMNKFGIEKYSGLQTFYSKNDPLSEVLALDIQKVVRTLLQPENSREVKKATSAIFVLDRLSVPAVLVECGFLSNARETALLCDKEYQQKLAFCIAMGIAEYFKK